MKRGNEVISQEAFAADSGFFSVFSFPFLSGNPQTALKQPHSVVISEALAEKQFGTTDALGKTISLKSSYGEKADFELYTVTGITKKCPQNSSIKFDVLLPLIVSTKEMENPENWFNVFQNTFVVLNPTTNPTPDRAKAVEAKMNQIYLADAKEAIKEQAERFGFKTKVSYKLQPFTDMHLSTDLPAQNGLVDQSNPVFSYILTGIALFILLIACINFVNLTIARSLRRAKEISVRKVVGSGRLQLTIQFLGESFLLCFCAFVLAIGLVLLVLPTFNQLANKSLALSYLFDVRLVLGYIGLFLATGFLAGFYPALVLSKYSPVQTLYNRFNLSGKNYLQKSLVVFQFSLASFLIIATLTIYSQFNYLTTKNLGYDDKGVVSVGKSGLTRREASLWKDELLKNQNIIDMAPKNGGQWMTVAKVNSGTEVNTGWYGSVMPAGLTPPSGYYQGQEQDGPAFFAQNGANLPNPCDFSIPRQVGTWNGLIVQFRQFPNNKRALVTAVAGSSNDKYCPRGNNFWDNFTKDPGVDQYRPCLNTGDTGWLGCRFRVISAHQRGISREQRQTEPRFSRPTGSG